MAKSFKQLAGSPPVKRTSEKDFLDFLEQDHVSAPTPPSSGAAAQAASEQTPQRSEPKKQEQAQASQKPAAEKQVKAPAASTATTAPAPITRRAPRVSEEKQSASKKQAAAEGPQKSYITDVTHNIDVTEQLADVRQTFVLGREYLENLKNFVHTRRMQGHYDFTQKEALHQALDLLFATAQIVERPDQIRQKEEVRRQQIRKGKAK